MEAPNDMKFGDRFGVARGGGLESFFEGHRVGARGVFFSTESAEAAGGYTHVGRINVAIDVEIRRIAVQAFADVVG